MDAQRRIRLGILAIGVGLGTLGLPLFGCGEGGGSSAAVVQDQEELENRENTIKDFYKMKQQAQAASKKKR